MSKIIYFIYNTATTLSNHARCPMVLSLNIVLFSAIILIGLAASTGEAQIRQVRGSVHDAVTHEPLGYANIVFTNGQNGTVTNEQGKFAILCGPREEELMVTCLGYQSQKVTVKPGDTSLVLVMTATSYLLQEVNVFAGPSRLDESSLNQMKGEQVAQMSGLTRDVYRAVQTLPGVSSNNEMNARFNVRGGTPDENLVMVNDIRVYEPYHLKEIPNVSIGIFNIDMVQKIDFMNGGFSAEYGDALSSVLNVKYRKGDTEHITGSFYTSLIDGGVLLEGPLSENCNWIFSARQSYLSLIMKMLHAKNEASANYDDVQGQIAYRLSSSNTLSLGFILSGDKFTMNPTNKITTNNTKGTVWNHWMDITVFQRDSAGTEYHCRNDFSSVKWSSILAPVLLFEGTLSYADEFSNQHQYGMVEKNYVFPSQPRYYYYWQEGGSLLENIETTTLESRVAVSYQPFSSHVLKGGACYQGLRYRVNRYLSGNELKITNLDYYPDTSVYRYPLTLQDFDSTALSVDSYKWSASLQDQWQAMEGIVLNIGARIDYFDLNRALSFSPRISASYSFSPQWYIRAAWGIYYQAPTYSQLKMNISSSTNTGNERAVHYIVGVEHRPSEDIDVRLETYYKLYTDIIPGSRLSNGTLTYRTKENNYEGYATGIDFTGSLVQTDLFVSFSYSYLTAMERQKKSDDQYYPRISDQRHTFSAVVSNQLGACWSGSVRCFYGSGYAFTPMHIVSTHNPENQVWVSDDHNSDHYPFYFRIDLRLEKQLSLWDQPMSLYLDIINLLSRNNVLLYRYTYGENGNPERQSVDLFPIIPSIGMMIKF